MFDESFAGAVLESVSLLSFDGYVTRFVYAAHQRTALAAVGAVQVGGRYNPPGVAALYTSFRRKTALGEATQFFDDEDPIKPMLMMSVRLATDAVLDLTDSAILAEPAQPATSSLSAFPIEALERPRPKFSAASPRSRGASLR